MILLPAFIKVFSFPSPVFCLHLDLPLSLWTTPAEKSQSSVLLKLLCSPFLSSLLEKLEEYRYFGVFWFVSRQLLPCNLWLSWRLDTVEQSSLLWQQCLLGSPPWVIVLRHSSPCCLSSVGVFLSVVFLVLFSSWSPFFLSHLILSRGFSYYVTHRWSPHLDFW